MGWSTSPTCGSSLLSLLFPVSLRGEEFFYQPDHELKPGPRLFSGEDV